MGTRPCWNKYQKLTSKLHIGYVFKFEKLTICICFDNDIFILLRFIEPAFVG